MKLILDTDLGTDVDDCLALALLLASPEVELMGVTCVYGDTLLRARIVRKLLALRGRDEVPVFAGAARPMLGLRDIYWEGHEGQGILTDEDGDLAPQPDFAPDWIARMAARYPGEIQLVAIGPLTNIALALVQEPRLPHLLRGVTIMGGVVRGADDLSLPSAEHNILCDPDAAHVVFSSALSLTVVPLNITVQAQITQKGLAQIQAAGTPFHNAVADQLARYPRFKRQGWTNPHDPMAVAALLRPELFTMIPVDIQVETAGRVSTGAIFPRANGQGLTQLVTAVDVAAFESFLISRLEA